MSQQQFMQTVAAEEEWLYEVRERRIEDANEMARESRASRDEEFREQLAEKFPQLRAWPGKDQK